LEPFVGSTRAPTATHCQAVPHPRRSFKPSRPTPPGSITQPRRSRPCLSSVPS
jgi:hypothetical protein